MSDTAAVQRLVAALKAWSAAAHPLVVAIDGRGASGKTTLTTAVAGRLEAAVVHTDDFFRPAVASAVASGPPRESEAIARYYDLWRLRTEALEPLLAGPTAIVLLEGVCSSSAPLADLIGRTVLVQVSDDERLERLRNLIAPDEWDDDWLAAEHLYFDARPAATFDLVLSGEAAYED